MEDRWLSVDEIADYLGVAKDTIYTWVTAKGMPGHKVGRFWKFTPLVVMILTTRSLVVNKQRSDQENDKMNDQAQVSKAPECALEEGKIFDYITGKPVKDSDKEQVRQRIARAIIHEYGIAAEDIEPDFKLKAQGKNRKLDLAIFKPGQPHTVDNLYRMVVIGLWAMTHSVSKGVPLGECDEQIR